MELSPVIATLLADTKEFMAKMDEAEHKVDEFGKTSEKTGTKVSNLVGKSSTAVIGLGAAFTGFALDRAMKFNEGLDQLQNQAGYTAEQADRAGKSILSISSATGIASANITAAYLQAAKAGLDNAKATQLVSDASKVAVVTGGDVATTTQTLIGIENLQIAKGMSVAQISDLMVEANKRHVGSLDTLTTALTGKVGGALKADGLDLAEIAAVSDVASKAGYNNARAYSSLATGLNKIESPTTKSAKSLALLGINAQTLASTARHPGTGLVDVLTYLEAVSKRTGTAMNTLISGTFGPGSVGLVSNLSTHIKDLTSNVTALGGASGTKLNTAFGTASKQLDTQMKIIEQRFVNSATQFGTVLIPYVKDAANVLSGAMDYISKNKSAQQALGVGLGTVVAGALTYKLAGAGIKMAEMFGMTFAAWAPAAFAGYAALFAGTFFGTLTLLNDLRNKATVKPSAKVAPWLDALAAAAGVTTQELSGLGAGSLRYLENKYNIHAPGSKPYAGQLAAIPSAMTSPKKTRHTITVRVTGHGTTGK